MNSAARSFTPRLSTAPGDEAPPTPVAPTPMPPFPGLPNEEHQPVTDPQAPGATPPVREPPATEAPSSRT